MELLLNLTWLVVSASLGALLLASRRQCEAAQQDSFHSRSIAWISYFVLIALLLPVISMTDDRMAMVASSDGERITRRYQTHVSGRPHQQIPVSFVRVMREGAVAPRLLIGNLEVSAAAVVLPSAITERRQGRAPPQLLSSRLNLLMLS